MKNKIVVTSTGRCGTTFLMELFTRLGLNTGFTLEECQKEIERHPEVRGGIEHGLDSEKIEKAHIIKNPEFARVDVFQELEKRFTVDHVIIPIRDLKSTALSRENLNNGHGKYGGFWLGAKNVEEQAVIHAVLMYDFLEYLSSRDIPFTLINFDLMMKNPLYLTHRLNPPFALWKGNFQEAYVKTIKKDWIRFRKEPENTYI